VDAAELAVVPAGPSALEELERDTLGGLGGDRFVRLAGQLLRRLQAAGHRPIGRRAVGERRRPGRGPVAPARSRPGRPDDAVAPAVMITDSFGRAWRHGQSDVAIGLAGMQPLDDWRGRTDASGLELRATWIAVADAAAAAADLARTKDSREPAVIIDGLERFVTAEDGPGAAALVRPLEEDLFR